MFATTVQAELNATLHVCESGLQDIRIFFGLVPKESPCINFSEYQIKKNERGGTFSTFGGREEMCSWLC
jgi:hypothetical protein